MGFLRRHWRQGRGTVLRDADKMPGAQFFPNAALNFSENLLRRRDSGDAIVFWGEDKVKQRLSFVDLYDQVAAISAFLLSHGVAVGDRVAGMMPNMPQTVAAALATAAIGAVWSSCSPDFGVQGVIDRFSQIEPKIFICCDGYYYAGKQIAIADKVEAILKQLPSITAVIVVDYVGEAANISATVGALTWDAALATPAPSTISFVRLPFSHPLYILYSSGTTGVPKCIVHSAGGGAASTHEGASIALQCDGRGKAVLLQHMRLDDVELARLRLGKWGHFAVV